MKIKHFLVITTIFLSCNLFAQENAIKLNLPSLGLKNFSFNYERVVTNHLSLNLGASYMLPRTIPTFLFDDNATENDEYDFKINSYSFTGELRLYTSSDAPIGFYIAPFSRYQRYPISGFYHWKDVDGNGNIIDEERVSVTGGFKQLGLGLQLGYQWVISDAVVVDLFFFGPWLGRSGIDLTFSEIEPANVQKIRTEIENLDIVFRNLTIDFGNDWISLKQRGFFPNYRFGLSLGYAF